MLVVIARATAAESALRRAVPREPDEGMLAAAEALPGCKMVNEVLLLHQARTGRILDLGERVDAAIWQAMYDNWTQRHAPADAAIKEQP
jgi:hypothetical protein